MFSDGQAKVYTFYSYKGGVGRSMALANIAELLYRNGLRVLMIDFDLEAPGLEQYFYKSGDPLLQKVLCQRGVIDLLSSYKSLRSLHDSPQPAPVVPPPRPSPETSSETAAVAGPGLSFQGGASPAAGDFPYPVEPLSGFTFNIYSPTTERPGQLSIITAGRRAKETLTPESNKKQTKDEFAVYADRVRSFAWDDFYLNLDGERFFDWFRAEALKDVDVVLIDSRTGVAEMSGVCTYQLADVVVMFVAANHQNVEGVRKIAESLTRRELIQEGRKGRDLSLILVPSRVDMSEKEKLDDLSARFRRMADSLISPDLKFDTNSFADLRIPYIPYYSFVEEIAVSDSNSPAAIDMRKAYENICRSLAQLDPKIAAKVRLDSHAASGPNLAEQQNRAANQVYEQLTVPEQKAARSLFTRLVRVARIEEGELKDSAKVVRVADLSDAQRQVAKKFAEKRLLVISKRAPEPATEGTTESADADSATSATVGLADESLIQNWALLKQWVEEDREFLTWRQELQSGLAGWEKRGRQGSDLLPPSKFDDARRWSSARRADLNAAEFGYIRESMSLRRRLLEGPHLWQTIGVALGVVALAFAAYQIIAERNRVRGLSRQLASNAESIVAAQPELSTLLAVEAARLATTTEARQALQKALVEPSVRSVIEVGGYVYSARFSHKGDRIATAGGDGPNNLNPNSTGRNYPSVAEIWREAGDSRWQRLVTLIGHDGDVTAATFSPYNDILVATSSHDGTVILWDSATGSMVMQLRRPTFDPGSFGDVAVSPDGKLVAAASFANYVHIWGDDARIIQTLTSFKNNVNSVAFSPDSKLLAAGNEDGHVRVWDTASWKEVTTTPLMEHRLGVNCVSFSPDGKMLLTTSTDGTARVWATDKWSTTTVFSEHSGPVNRAAFSPDGKFVVTASADTTAMVWEAATGRRVATLRAPPGRAYNELGSRAVTDASFSPDGKLILTAGADGAARLWDLRAEVGANASTDELSELACRKVTRNMTADEWRQYMGAEPYRATCQGLPQPTPAAQAPTPDARAINANAGPSPPQNMNMNVK